MSSPNYENIAPIAKLKVSISKIKGLERSTWIKIGEIMNEAFKDWKNISTSIPQEQNWSFLINQAKGPLLKNSGQWNVDKSWQIQENIGHFE